MSFVIWMQIILCYPAVWNPPRNDFRINTALHADRRKIVVSGYLCMHNLRISTVIIINIVHQHHSRFVFILPYTAYQSFICLTEKFCRIIIDRKFYNDKIRLMRKQIGLCTGGSKMRCRSTDSGIDIMKLCLRKCFFPPLKYAVSITQLRRGRKTSLCN